MKRVIVKLRSVSPYSQSKHYDVEKLEKEKPADYEKRTWFNRQHWDKEGIVFIPAMAFKICLQVAAKYLSIKIAGKGQATYTKHFEAGVMCMDNVSLGVHYKKTDGDWQFVPSDGRRGGPKRVSKCFPVIPHWEATVVYYILDETITKDVFKEHLIQAGQFIGLGRFRPRKAGYYGRFEVVKIE